MAITEDEITTTWTITQESTSSFATMGGDADETDDGDADADGEDAPADATDGGDDGGADA